MQFHEPSWPGQGVPAAVSELPAVVSVLLLAGTSASGTVASGVDEPEVTFVGPVGAALATGAAEATGVTVATGASVALALGATVAKTPPLIPDGVAAADDVDCGLSEELSPPPDPPPAWQFPTGGAAVPLPSFSTDSPAEGNKRSLLSAVVQPFPMFAVNISGRAS